MFAIAEFNNLLARLNQGIVRGDHAKVREELGQLVLTEVPRDSYLNLAQLASRAGIPALTLRLLGRLLKERRNAPEPISDEEVAEYAMALLQVGASQESLRLLRTIDGRLIPRALLYQAFSLITEWNYVAAIPVLETYIGQSGLDDYQIAVAKLNLSASYSQTRQYEKAEGLLANLTPLVKRADYKLLFGNCLEMSAHLAIFTGKFDKAAELLNEASKILNGSGSLYLFFIHKWRALLDLYRQGPSDSAITKWKSIRAEAIELGHWETVREHDRYLSIFSRDQDLLLKVYFGTPFTSYRESLLLDFPEPSDIPLSYNWSPIGFQGCNSVDLDSAVDQASGASLKNGSALHRLFKALASDFYRVSSIGSLFNMVYPDEVFNISNSPLRLHQLIFRLREWFKTNSMPIEVSEVRNGYRLRFLSPYSIRVSRTQTNNNASEMQIIQLVSAFQDRIFSAKEAAEQFGVSKRQINKLIEKDDGRSLEKIGSGPTTRYRTRAA